MLYSETVCTVRRFDYFRNTKLNIKSRRVDTILQYSGMFLTKIKTILLKNKFNSFKIKFSGRKVNISNLLSSDISRPSYEIHVLHFLRGIPAILVVL